MGNGEGKGWHISSALWPHLPHIAHGGCCTHTRAHKGGGGRTGVIAAHLPQARAILAEWADSQRLKRDRCMMGADLNESFQDVMFVGVTACTSRGEEILEWIHEQQLYIPDQKLHVPSYHPYNTRMASRRLDYVILRGMDGGKSGAVIEGSKDIAMSDHDAVELATTTPSPKDQSTEGAKGAQIRRASCAGNGAAPVQGGPPHDPC